MRLLKNKVSADVPTVERLPAPIAFVFPVDGIKNARWFSLKIKIPFYSRVSMKGHTPITVVKIVNRIL